MSSKYAWLTLLAGGALPTLASAQPLPLAPPVPPEEDTLFFVENLPPVPALGGKIDIIRSEGDVQGPVVTGKPYSAKSITESTQTLADGNRITRRNESVIYRDSEGRSRREQTLNGVGPWQAEQPLTMITIHDPVAGRSYVLDPVERNAREIRPFQIAIGQAQDDIAGAAGEVRTFFSPGLQAPAPISAPLPSAGAANVTVVQRADGANDVQVFTRAVGGGVMAGAFEARVPAEDLGEQVLEGLLVQGTRTVDRIPAGAIGNERPIEIVTELWYSKDIDALVLHRFADPRFGETTYRLVNVVRGEPSPDLFEVPRGYEVEAAEMPRPGVRVMRGTPGPVIEFGPRRTEPADEN